MDKIKLFEEIIDWNFGGIGGINIDYLENRIILDVEETYHAEYKNLDEALINWLDSMKEDNINHKPNVIWSKEVINYVKKLK